MFKKSKQVHNLDLNEQEISTIIGLDFEFNGQVKGTNVIRIDGKITGNVTIENGLILGEKGMVVGDVNTKSAIIYGCVTGNVKCTQLEIKKTGKINGDIKTETLEIELGAQYNGKLEMKQMIKTEEKLAVDSK